MNLHEYQAKQILASHGVSVPWGEVAGNGDEAVAGAEKLGGGLWVVKAQVHAGGRGKAGGIKVCKSHDEVRSAADGMIGQILVTHQTGPEGKPIHKVYVEEGFDIVRELYLALLVDRDSSRIAVIASTEGGMDIEEVAASAPEKIITLTIDPASGLQPFHGRRLADALKLEDDQVKQCGKLLASIYRTFIASDASMLEINPLVVSGSDDLVVLDCKFNIDDNAMFRHKELAEMRDESQEDPSEREAHEVGLNYVKLDGNIGCMVNGAGLAMATMDICKLAGGEPANFLDVGGGATKEQVAAAFRIIVSDPNVQAILVNIFGGIMLCDVIAQGIVAAAKELDLKVPVVVRLEGTNVKKGKEILAQSRLALTPADDLSDAAAKAVAAIGGDA
ncbi:MAG: ADP-forming succinate--CoA ligase subunit beta [Rhodospirillaceae bacterium]|nr:ADP-forming succinate--CoA ligase subunit beta [Rhodospirillaceae bacterium]|tara:strand:+ start:11581 stop:12750 length:1170 start_codon:yes stop_codon:yes gene_type:complete